MGETTGYTDVADAFDDDDPFDLNVSVGFVRSVETTTIQREQPLLPSDDGRPTAHWTDMAESEHVSNRLMLGLDIGLYHDLMIFGRLPLVLSDTRKLSEPANRRASEVNADLNIADPDPDNPDHSAQQLFSIPFESPTRSGLDYIEVGAAWGILNQHRDRSGPTWVIQAAGRINIGEPLHACTTVPSTICAGGGTNPGMSQGTNALRLETRGSYRYRYVEPYAGLLFHIEWPGSAESTFLPSGNLSGIMNEIPSRQGEMTVGLAVIPWENRGRFQRFALDTRLTATYVSEGHSYTPLFDALGSSGHSGLTRPRYEAVDSMGNPGGRSAQFLGLTDTESHGRFMLRTGVEMQAAKYVRFTFGGGIGFTTPYLLTFTDSCNPNINPDPPATTPGELSRTGNCRHGIINPHYRDVIDLAGRRFRADTSFDWDLYVSATGQI